MKKCLQGMASGCLAVLLFLCMCPWVMATGEANEIKVGYVPNYGTMQYPAVKGSEGYGYEYFVEIARHMAESTNVTFVSCDTWEEGIALLEQGEIDVFGPTTNLDLEGVVYSASDFGDCHMVLATLDTLEAYYGDYDAFQGATIGIPRYYAQELDTVTGFLQTYGIDANLVMVPSNGLGDTVESGVVDYVLMSSFQTQMGLQAVARIGSAPAYYIAAEPEVMVAIDAAMEKLEQEEFLYQTQLYAKYLDYGATAKVHISQEEYELLQEKGTYTVGIRDFASPLCQINEDGTFSGVSFDVMEVIAADAGVSFAYVVLDPDDPQEKYDQVDLLLIDTTKADGYGFYYESNPYMELPFLLLERTDSRDDGLEGDTVGVVDYYQVDVHATDGMLYGRQVVEYRTIEELRQAFTSGEVDSILLTVSALNLVQEDLADTNYRTEALGIDLSVCLAFSDRVSGEEITVFNKLISRVADTTVDASVLTYSMPAREDGVLAYVWSHPGIIIAVGLLVVLVLAIVERRRRKALDAILNVDTLTGLMTERKFIEEAKELLEIDPEEVYYMVSLDVDNFKYVNEIYGYQAGTQLIKLVGEQVRQKAGPKTLIARASGDKFLVMTPEAHHREIIPYIEEDIQTIQTAMGHVIGKTYKLYFSFGVYCVRDHDMDVTAMIDNANVARQAGKDKAGTSVCHFTDQMKAERDNSNYFTSIMEQALADQEFVLHYQPKVSMETGAMIGAEALVRWKRAANFMPPYQFIPLFERNGFIEQLDYYVLGKACEFLLAHPDFDQGRISVNISSASLLQKNVVQNLIAVVERHGVSPARLDLEITESALVGDESALEKLEVLRNYGFTISMDDFGVGVSSLNRLKNMDVDTLKIDRAFIIDALENARGREILKHVIQMAESLHLETVAEGIETQEQHQLLKDLGCHVGQGYHYARPIDEEAFVRYYQGGILD